MSTRKHRDHPHLTGEHRWGDTGQLILLIIFLTIWITDSFVFQYSTFLNEKIPNLVRMPIAVAVFITGGLLARGGMRTVFGTERKQPEVIDTGVFRIVRHPIYLGALLFYLGAIISTLSLASGILWMGILGFYIWIARYEEKILVEEFGDDYLNYKKKVGMLFPRINL
ncbi:MAG: methyltransferase family protein [Bacteroidales bacterium]